MDFLMQKQVAVFNTKELPRGHYARIKYRIRNSNNEWITCNEDVIIIRVSEYEIEFKVICSDDCRRYLYFNLNDNEYRELISLRLMKFVYID